MELTVGETRAKSILIKRARVDSWFLSRYGFNIYRGCTHACAYCDGRAERYHVEGEFGSHVTVKVNAAELLRRALDPARKRVPLRPSYVALGGGVGDTYQPIEERYGLARACLEVVEERGFPVHVLTKSCLVERDFDIIGRIAAARGAILGMSFSSVDDETSAVFEPGASPPSRRLETLARARERGIATGMYLMPVIPFATDAPEMIDASVARAKTAGVDFVVFGGMTLKDGRQREAFMRVLDGFRPGLELEYGMLYSGNRWGGASPDYYASIGQVFGAAAKHYGVCRRPPPRLYRDVLDETDRVVVVLDSLDWLLKMEGRDSPYGYAAWSVSKLKEPISAMRARLRELKGVGKVTERIVLEVLDTGTSRYLESML
jgi:DNA repair photolyase